MHEDIMKLDYEKRLYKVNSGYNNEYYFESMDELLEFCREEFCSTKSLKIVDYIKEFDGRSDVLRIQDSLIVRVYSMVDGRTLAVYDENKKIWEYKANIYNEMFDEFKNRGIEMGDTKSLTLKK